MQGLRVQTNSFAAEYGKVSGGVIAITTKSGTDRTHGSAYGLPNLQIGREQLFGNLGIPSSLRISTSSAALGGPILKTVFSTDYQGVRSAGFSTITGDIVPDSNFLKGGVLPHCGLRRRSGACHRIHPLALKLFQPGSRICAFP